MKSRAGMTVRLELAGYKSRLALEVDFEYKTAAGALSFERPLCGRRTIDSFWPGL